MRSKSILGVVLAFGVMFSLLAGSGIGAAVFGAAPADADTTRTLDDVSNDSSVDPDSESGGLSADVVGDNEPTLVGVALSGGEFAAQLVASVALVPVTLIRLGFPTYFAVPVGGVAQVIAFIGLVQFVRGTEYI
jgi:ABC-type oligopeptide transport system substrate-binding subunit